MYIIELFCETPEDIINANWTLYNSDTLDQVDSASILNRMVNKSRVTYGCIETTYLAHGSLEAHCKWGNSTVKPTWVFNDNSEPTCKGKHIYIA